MKLARVLLAVFIVTTMAVACDKDEDPATPEGLAVGKVAGNVVFFQSIEIQLRGYPQGSQLLLRPGIYWSPSELSEDPRPVVTQLGEASFRVDFGNLSQDKFITPDAEILLVVVDSVADELSGVVVLCSDQGSILFGAGCAGDCAPDCGLPGHDCSG